MSNIQLPSETDVLIVGAGPAGLATALSVSCHAPECKITIVDALAKGQNDSRAIVIHSATMEHLDSIGYSKPFAEMGRPSDGMSLQSISSRLLVMEQWRLKPWTKFPYVLIIAQSTTEGVFAKILKERNITILRPFKLLEWKETTDDGGMYPISATFEGGMSIKTKYIVGADGSRSIVRSCAHIPFHHIDSTDSGFSVGLADIKLSNPLPPSMVPKTLTMTFSKRGFFLFVPVPISDLTHTTSFVENSKKPTTTDNGEEMFRIAFNIPPTDLQRAESLDVNYLQERIREGLMLFGADGRPAWGSTEEKEEALGIKEVLWKSTFKIRNALSETFFKSLGNGGKVLLVGDAAHIHSPAGGQGMNMGICDGLEAGEAIVSHLRTSSDTQLHHFSTHRRKTASDTIGFTKNLNWFGNQSGWFSGGVRDWMLWSIGRVGFMRRALAWRISGLGDYYKNRDAVKDSN